MYFLRADAVITETDLLFVTKRKYAKQMSLLLHVTSRLKKCFVGTSFEFLSKD